MTPAEAAREVAGDLDMIGTEQADWEARWWYRFAHYLSTPALQTDVVPGSEEDLIRRERGWTCP